MTLDRMVSLAYLAVVHRGEIEALITKLEPYWPMVEPIIAKVQNDWPHIAPLVSSLKQAFLPTEERRYDVTWLQQSLNKVGAHLFIDGQMGDATHAAIRWYQSTRHLTVDGWAGTVTCATLDKETRNLP